MRPRPARPETVFTYGSPALKFGRGAVDEIGFDLQQHAARRVLVVTDAGVAAAGHPQRVVERITATGIEVVLYDRAHVEPSDASLNDAVAFASEEGPFDLIVAVGGGTAIDTAKAVALLTTNPGDLLDYVNPPAGRGMAPPNPVVPLVAVPTTTGTGSESTTVCVLDVSAMQVKTGISHPRLRPVLAVVDPELTFTQPPEVTAAAGLDILCHALESWTARPYTSYERKEPHERVPYCGANPVADLWAERSLRLLSGAFRRAVRDGADAEAREQMALAATFAGMGFGNAGVHLPHANAYPVAGHVRDFHPAGYPEGHALVPHGMAVALTAPASFRFTFEADPERHLRAVELFAPDATPPLHLRDALPDALVRLMRDVGMPNGLGAIGYTEDDIPALVAGTLQQQRLLATAPCEVTEDDVADVLRASFELW